MPIESVDILTYEAVHAVRTEKSTPRLQGPGQLKPKGQSLTLNMGLKLSCGIEDQAQGGDKGP